MSKRNDFPSSQTIYLRSAGAGWPIKMAIIIIVMYQAMGRYGNQRQRPRQSSINKRAISIFNNAPEELILELRS